MASEEIMLDTDRGYHISCLDGGIAGQKAVILCLHGFKGSKRSLMIERLHQEMERADIGTFTFDWPAHGESDAAFSDLNVPNCIKDLEQIYDHVSEKYKVPVWCFATSFGGFLAMIYHQSRPGAFGKIMLRSPALKMGQVMTNAMDRKKYDDFMNGAAVDFGKDQPLILTRAFYDSICEYDIYDEPPAFPERIRIIHGDRDDLVPPEDSIGYAERYGITLHLLSNATHYYDNPGDAEWVMREAVEFFKD